MQLPSNADTTFETTLDQTSNTTNNTTVDDSKLDDTANETNGDEDNDDVDDGIDTSEIIDANTTADHTKQPTVKMAKPDTLQSVDDNGSITPARASAPTPAPAPATTTPAAAAVVKAAENKSEDKNISRSGRVIKRTKYLLDEFEESPVGQTIKRKRPLDSPATVQKRRKSDEGSGENGTFSPHQNSVFINHLFLSHPFIHFVSL